MEKILNADERIRRAEDNYYKRKPNNNVTKYETATVNIGKKRNFKLLKKIAIQIFICTIIYFLYCSIQNKETKFSQEFRNKIHSVLAYDINLELITENVQKFFSKEIVQEPIEQITEEVVSNVVEETLSITDTSENNIVEEVSSINQMEEDVNFVKNNNSFIIPVGGTITSRFGVRNPTTETVPIYHTGTDIGANEGTAIIASMQGKVTQVSNQGDYRKSHKNRKWRSNYLICTLQSNLCKRRRYNKTGRQNC